MMAGDDGKEWAWNGKRMKVSNDFTITSFDDLLFAL
jgi:hypothetical protein